METAADLAAFLDDFGVAVVWGGVQTAGIYDAPGALQINAQLVDTDHALRFRTASLPGLDTGEEITVNAIDYVVRYVLPVGDGSFSVATMQQAEA